MSEFKTKTFSMLAPFELVQKDATMVNSEDTITIAGYANYSGIGPNGTTFVDLAGDVVVVDGMDVTMWAANPVILMNHNREQVIGKGTKVEKRSDGIYIEAEIHKDAMSPQDWYRLKNGLICRYSIGFRTQNSEYREVNGESVYFITKSLLLETSCTSIPSNAMSSFSVIKSLPNGEFTNDSREKFSEVDKEVSSIQTEDTLMKIKIKRSELLSEKELDTFKSLGGDAEAETEVDLSAFIKGVVANAVDQALAAKEEEAKAAADAEEARLAEEAANAEKAAAEAEEARLAEEVKQAEAAAEAETEEVKVELDELKALVASLKATLEIEVA